MNQYWNTSKWGARSWRIRCWKVPLFSAYVNVICWYDVLINLGCVGVLLVCYKDLSGKKRRSWTKRKPRAKWYLIKRGLSYNIYVRREKRHFSAASSPASSPSFSSISVLIHHADLQWQLLEEQLLRSHSEVLYHSLPGNRKRLINFRKLKDLDVRLEFNHWMIDCFFASIDHIFLHYLLQQQQSLPIAHSHK